MSDSQPQSAIERLAKWVQPWLFSRRYPELRVQIDAETRKSLQEIRRSPAVICPNHSRHEDGELMFLVSILTKQPVKFLAAREMFRSYLGFGGVVLRALGCYEIDRGATNENAIRSVQERLVNESSKIVIFPEGEISYDNDRVEKFEHGAVAIALESCLLLKQHERDDEVYLLPLAISYQFEDPRSVCEQVLQELERDIHLPLKQGTLYSRAERVCELYLNSLSETMNLSCANANSLDAIDGRVSEIVDVSLQTLSNEMGCQLPKSTQLHQIHSLQSKIFSARKKSSILRKSKFDKLYAETLNLVRLRSISAAKFDENHSLNSLADLLCNLKTLITRKQTRAVQHAVISACDLIKCCDFVEQFEKERDRTVEKVTELVARSVEKRLADQRSNNMPASRD